jgi:SpoVK/Ycf46/Vps4 family AAA+-type ATPase
MPVMGDLVNVSVGTVPEVSPSPDMSELDEITTKVRQGLGSVVVLFSGVSGTGKTMAAKVLAEKLGSQVVRIDSSTLVSKYIGETEKNLRRVLEEASKSGSILLFDEADALFGKRTEVKDSHDRYGKRTEVKDSHDRYGKRTEVGDARDRYANQAVSHLLAWLENEFGLMILSTNLAESIDRTLVRRLHLIIEFS